MTTESFKESKEISLLAGLEERKWLCGDALVKVWKRRNDYYAGGSGVSGD